MMLTGKNMGAETKIQVYCSLQQLFWFPSELLPWCHALTGVGIWPTLISLASQEVEGGATDTFLGMLKRPLKIVAIWSARWGNIGNYTPKKLFQEKKPSDDYSHPGCRSLAGLYAVSITTGCSSLCLVLHFMGFLKLPFFDMSIRQFLSSLQLFSD